MDLSDTMSKYIYSMVIIAQILDWDLQCSWVGLGRLKGCRGPAHLVVTRKWGLDPEHEVES